MPKVERIGRAVGWLMGNSFDGPHLSDDALDRIDEADAAALPAEDKWDRP